MRRFRVIVCVSIFALGCATTGHEGSQGTGEETNHYGWFHRHPEHEETPVTHSDTSPYEGSVKTESTGQDGIEASTSTVEVAEINQQETASEEAEPAFTQKGKASWYDGGRRKTASGERYNAKELTAAHKELDFGTMVKVTRTDTGESVTVRINDRGPFRRGRIIDLNRAAATQLGILHCGTVPVEIRTVE